MSNKESTRELIARVAQEHGITVRIMEGDGLDVSLLSGYTLWDRKKCATIVFGKGLSQEWRASVIRKELRQLSENTEHTQFGFVDLLDQISDQTPGKPCILTSSVITSSSPHAEGRLLIDTSSVIRDIVGKLCQDWSGASEISPERWEEIIAATFHKSGYDDVVLTPRSGDKGRDVVAYKYGVGSVKIIGSVKAYASHRKVPYGDVRDLAGVVGMEQDASKGMLITTSCFPSKIEQEPFISRLLPTRLELIDKDKLLDWLIDVHTSSAGKA